MKIGKMVKTLRREKNMTQEALAEQLNISVSAVSQWEMEKTMPDISMLPLLMDIFDVTADKLLGINEQEEDTRVKAVIDEAETCHSRFEHDKQLALMEQLYKEYPNRPDVMSFYAFTLKTTLNKPGHIDKCIEICKRILDRSLDDKRRFRAIKYLCECYAFKGDKESALYYADKLPKGPHFCGNWLKAQMNLWSDEERMVNYQQNAESFLWLLSETIFDIADPNYTNPNCKFTVAERAAILEQLIAIEQILYGDKLCNMHHNMYTYHRVIGALWLFEKEHEKALDYLEKAYDHAEQFATSFSDGDTFTASLVFRGWPVTPYSFWRHGKNAALQDLHERFEEQERYKVLENNPRFIALKEKLASKLK